ncbi:helix-turn-helix domain-containing protein [Parerythrobacter aurantius]|uniref:helix-turn-helix domain-containing protein n=1 Tax=Parerythrobacter aurantius TaxID=3127706 RepID=UPI00324C137D
MADRILPTTEYSHDGLRLRLSSVAPDLAPYISSLYRTEVDAETVIEDWLPPEEANLRTGSAETYTAAIGTAPLAKVPANILSGATDRVTHLRVAGGRFWGIGLTPAGWARFIDQPADGMANRFADTAACALDPSLPAMLATLRHEIDDMEQAADLVAQTFRPLLARRRPVEARVQAVHLHIVSEDIASAAELAEAVNMTDRTLGRFCKRHFGFSPGALLRRQRFLRSLGKYMLDPSLRWINSLDPNYWDQAQFIRDFRAIMHMTPSEYAGLSHPVVGAAVAVTSAGAGVAMQALFHPDRPREAETGL